jgi:hypothetical protein
MNLKVPIIIFLCILSISIIFNVTATILDATKELGCEVQRAISFANSNMNWVQPLGEEFEGEPGWP